MTLIQLHRQLIIFLEDSCTEIDPKIYVRIQKIILTKITLSLDNIIR